MRYPTLVQVRHASHLQVCRWYRYLQTPATPMEARLLKAVLERYAQGGGITPGISKQLEAERGYSHA